MLRKTRGIRTSPGRAATRQIGLCVQNRLQGHPRAIVRRMSLGRESLPLRHRLRDAPWHPRRSSPLRWNSFLIALAPCVSGRGGKGSSSSGRSTRSRAVPALSWVPVVDDYLHRYPPALHAGDAFAIVGLGAQRPVSALAVDRQFRCQTVPEGTDGLRTRCGARDEFQGVDLVKLRHFHSRIVYSRAFARHFVSDTKPVLRLCALADGDPA